MAYIIAILIIISIISYIGDSVSKSVELKSILFLVACAIAFAFIASLLGFDFFMGIAGACVVIIVFIVLIMIWKVLFGK